MNNVNAISSKVAIGICIGAICIIGFLLRLAGYTQYPVRGETSDEYAYAFAGISLITEGRPISWSLMTVYPTRQDLIIDDIYFPIVDPYLDHPPLFSVMTGAVALMAGQNSFDQISLKAIRLVPIALSTIAIGLVFMIGQRLYGVRVGVFSALIYATVPLFIYSSRLAVSESLLVVIMLVAMYVLAHKKVPVSSRKLTMVGFLSGLALLTKFSGLYIAGASILYAYAHHISKRQWIIFSGACLAGVLLYVLYYATYDLSLYWAVQTYHSGREVGYETIWKLVTMPALVHTPVVSPWYFGGVFALLSMFASYKKHELIIVFSSVYLLFLILTVNQHDLHGWYAIPLYPLFSISLGVLFSDISNRMSYLSLVVITSIGIGCFTAAYHYVFGLTSSQYRSIALLAVVPLIYVLMIQNSHWYRIIITSYLFLMILCNVVLAIRNVSLFL